MATQYESALADYELANRRLRHVKEVAAKQIEAAQMEFDAAQTKLVEMEIAPGIPDPRFHSAFRTPAQMERQNGCV